MSEHSPIEQVKQEQVNLAVMFGGRAVEHEISVISALQLIMAADCSKYNVVPVYIATDGKWYSGMDLLDKSIYRSFAQHKDKLHQVTLLPEPNSQGLRLLKFSDQAKIPVLRDHIAVDVVLPIFHGEIGENGCLQGLLEMAELPYSGFNVIGSAIAMNKQLCKDLLRANEVPVLPGLVLRKYDFIADPVAQSKRIFSHPGLENFPVFVKPNNRGSSIGIAKVRNKEELIPALLSAFSCDLEVVVEPFLGEMFEINIAVISDAAGTRTSVVEIPYSEQGFLSYEDKYLKDNGAKKGQGEGAESQGMASLTRAVNPSDLDPQIKATVTQYALKAFSLLGNRGNTRIDFMVDKKANEIYLNEINPLPGSCAFYLWAESDPQLLYPQIIDQMVATAIRERSEQLSIESFIGFNALK